MRGRVLKVKLGFNPNSSSIGTSLTPLLLGGLFAVILAPLVSFLLLRRLRKTGNRGALVAPQPEQPEATTGHSGSGASAEPDTK